MKIAGRISGVVKRQEGEGGCVLKKWERNTSGLRGEGKRRAETREGPRGRSQRGENG